MRTTLPLLPVLLALLAPPVAEAQTFTAIHGYTRITVPSGTLAAISASLRAPAAFTGNAVVNADYNPTAGTQTITAAGVSWSTNPSQWAEPNGVAHLCYVSDSNGGEEAFLIVSHTADTLTISTTFDLQDAARPIPDDPATTSIVIGPANTIGGLFGDGAQTDFESGDFLYIWDGSGWATYFYANGWRKAGQGGTFEKEVVFPDEGFFISRNAAGDLVISFLGDVPAKPQVTTIPGPGTQMISSRYPIETTIGALGLETLPGWQGQENFLFIWDVITGWDTYFYINGWRKAGEGGTRENDPIPANAAVFVKRSGSSTPEESGKQHPLPYTP